MVRTEAQRRGGGLFVGIAILVVGTLILLDNFGVRVPDLDRLWPLILIAIGAHKLWQSRLRSFWGVVLVVAGTLFLLHNFYILNFNVFKLWPLLLIAIGLRILRQSMVGPLPPVPVDASSSSLLDESAAFGGGERRLATEDFRGGHVTVAFGGFDIDLTDSAIKESPAVVNVVATFAGVDIRIPTGWDVSVKVLSIFGGCDDKTVHPASDANAPKLVLTGYAVFGGCEVKN